MKFIVDGTDMVKKKVGGKSYGYLYLPKGWIGCEVAVIRQESSGAEGDQASKKYKKLKLYAKKKLEKLRYTVSENPINCFGKSQRPLLIGNRKNRMVVVIASVSGTVKAQEIVEDLSSASAVLYLVMPKSSRLSKKATKKIKRLGNVKIWRIS